MRIISGKFKGRRLATPKDESIRPTSDRTRESIFNLLMHGQYGGAHVIDCDVADLCCGTGALGLEALSRGAKSATFVDMSKAALALAKDNAGHCGALQQSHFLLADITRLPMARVPMQLVMIDAPYGKALLSNSYLSLQQQGWLEPGTLIVHEQSRDAFVATLEGAELLDQRQYGKTVILIYRVT